MPIDNTYVYNPKHSNLYLSEWGMPYNWNYKSAVVSNVGWMPSYELNNGTWVNLFGEPVGVPEGISADGVPDTGWHEDWLGNRQQLLKNNMNNTAYSGNTYSDADAFNMFLDEINNLKGYREYIPAPGTYPWKEGLAGITEYGPREINYNPSEYEFIHYPSSLIVHERTHGLDSPEGGITKRHIPLLNMIDQIMHNTYGKGWIYDPEYKEEFGGDNYIDNPSEIYSRMMSIRHDASLNPNNVLNRDTLEELRKDPRVTDYDKERTLNRYDDDTLLRLFNEVAHNNTDNDMVNYAANGGSIHINPKNKGKFNATKKRTGKTTEELTHSKNPLTRKRAIFALNAKKWKHDEGGPLIDVPVYTPWIDDVEKEGYRDYMWRLAATKAGEWGDPLEEVYDYMLNDPSFNYRRWYNTSSPEELERFLHPGAGHWRDKDGKTVWHPTTSKESPYSGYINPYNPKGIEFGDWYSIPQNYVEEESGIDRYELSDDQINNDWDINRTYRELAKSRANPNELNNSYITYKGGVMIPELTVSPTGNYYPQNTINAENIGDIIPYPSKKANGGDLINNNINSNDMKHKFANGGSPTDPPYIENQYSIPENVKYGDTSDYITNTFENIDEHGKAGYDSYGYIPEVQIRASYNNDRDRYLSQVADQMSRQGGVEGNNNFERMLHIVKLVYADPDNRDEYGGFNLKGYGEIALLLHFGPGSNYQKKVNQAGKTTARIGANVAAIASNLFNPYVMGGDEMFLIPSMLTALATALNGMLTDHNENDLKFNMSDDDVRNPEAFRRRFIDDNYKADGGTLNNNNNMNRNYFDYGGGPTDPPFVYNRATGEYDLPEVVVTPNRFSEGLEEMRDAQNLYDNYENTLLSLADYTPNMSALEAQKAQEQYLLRRQALEEAIDRRYRDDINEAMRRYFIRKRACGGKLYAEGGDMMDPAMMQGGEEVPPEMMGGAPDMGGGMPPEAAGGMPPQGVPVELAPAQMPGEGYMPPQLLEEGYPLEHGEEEEKEEQSWEEGFWEARDEALAEGKKTFAYDGKVYPTDLGAKEPSKRSNKKKNGGKITKVPKEILPY